MVEGKDEERFVLINFVSSLGQFTESAFEVRQSRRRSISFLTSASALKEEYGQFIESFWYQYMSFGIISFDGASSPWAGVTNEIWYYEYYEALP